MLYDAIWYDMNKTHKNANKTIIHISKPNKNTNIIVILEFYGAERRVSKIDRTRNL